VLAAILPNTGQSESTLLSILIIGGVLVIAGVAAMVAMRVSRKKNADAATFKPEAAAEKSAAKKPAAEKPAGNKAAAKKPAAKKPAAKKAAKPAADGN
jgi:LPXTG-motif cell wall-anchored protein